MFTIDENGCLEKYDGQETSVTVPDGVSKIGSLAFYKRRDIITSVYLPDSVEIIDSNAFNQCECLTNIRMPAHLKEIGIAAFWNCKMLNDVSIPDSVQKIGYSCFEGSGIVSIKLPHGITKIEKETFMHCKNLGSITIPESVQEIHKNAFLETGLRSIRIPASVQVVGEAAFARCNSLEDVTICSKDTKFAKGHDDFMMFPYPESYSRPRLRGDGFSIPGPWKYGKIAAHILALLIGSVGSCIFPIVYLAIFYFYLKKKYPHLSLMKDDERKLILSSEFGRPWYERVSVIEGDLPDYLDRAK